MKLDLMGMDKGPYNEAIMWPQLCQMLKMVPKLAIYIARTKSQEPKLLMWCSLLLIKKGE